MKKFLSGVMAIFLVMSLLGTVVLAEEFVYGTYFDGETYKIENFYKSSMENKFHPMNLNRKTVYSIGEKIIQERYDYDGDGANIFHQQFRDRLMKNGWDLASMYDFGNNMECRLEKGIYTIYMSSFTSDRGEGYLYLYFSLSEYYGKLPSNVVETTYDTVDGGEETNEDDENSETTVEEDTTANEDEEKKNQIRMTIGSSAAQVFGEEYQMDVAPQIINGRTMLPARFVAELLGGEVIWYGDANLVIIKKDEMVLVFKIGDNRVLLTYSYKANSEKSVKNMLREKFEEISGALALVSSDNSASFEDLVEMESWYRSYRYSIKDYDSGGGASTIYAMDSAPVIIDGRTFMPVRAIATFLGAEVEWDNATRTVIITPSDKK